MPGSNRISGDGVNLVHMITAAWQTNYFHLDSSIKHVPDKQYRYAAAVPKGREAALLHTLRDAVQRFFAITVDWQDQEREVLVIKSSKALEQSSSQETLTFMRGDITRKRQPISKLASTLPNFLKKIVVDETGLDGQYDFFLSYRSDSPEVLLTDLRSKYGLTLLPAKRRVRMLMVKPEN